MHLAETAQASLLIPLMSTLTVPRLSLLTLWGDAPNPVGFAGIGWLPGTSNAALQAAKAAPRPRPSPSGGPPTYPANEPPPELKWQDDSMIDYFTAYAHYLSILFQDYVLPIVDVPSGCARPAGSCGPGGG